MLQRREIHGRPWCQTHMTEPVLGLTQANISLGDRGQATPSRDDADDSSQPSWDVLPVPSCSGAYEWQGIKQGEVYETLQQEKRPGGHVTFVAWPVSVSCGFTSVINVFIVTARQSGL